MTTKGHTEKQTEMSELHGWTRILGKLCWKTVGSLQGNKSLIQVMFKF